MGGFSAVLGNPPWVRGGNLSASFKSFASGQLDTFRGAGDIYIGFMEISTQITSHDGRMSYVLQNKWLTSNYGSPIRRFLVEATRIVEVVDFGHSDVFAGADTFPMLLSVQNSSPEKGNKFLAIPNPPFRSDWRAHMANKPISCAQDDFSDKPWMLASKAELLLFEKLKTKHANLSSIYGPVHQGITPGRSEVFIISKSSELFDHAHNADFSDWIYPMHRGRNMNRWVPDEISEYMIGTYRRCPHPPDWLFDYLLKNKEVLQQRSTSNHAWYELQGVSSKIEDYLCEKIMYQEIMSKPKFCLGSDRALMNNKVYFIQSKDPVLLAWLNSDIVYWYLWKALPPMKDDGRTAMAAVMSEVPVPHFSDENRAKIENLISRSNLASKDDQLELEINELIFSATGIDESERTIIQEFISSKDRNRPR